VAELIRLRQPAVPRRSGAAVDNSVEVVVDGTFQGPAELGRLLLDQDLVQGCVVEQLGQYALGRVPTAADRPLLEALEASFAGSDYAFDQLLVEYVASEAFGLRREPEVSP
jgi:hypothetical protein